MAKGERMDRDQEANSAGRKERRTREPIGNTKSAKSPESSAVTGEESNPRRRTHAAGTAGNGAHAGPTGTQGHAGHGQGARDGDHDGYRGVSAEPIPPPTWRRRLYVDRPGDLVALAKDLKDAHVLAIDAEFAQARVREPDAPSHRLALLQLAIDNDYRVSYVVDALRLADLSPLQAVFEDGRILKLFHGIGADARMLAARDLVARHTLDLEAVSRSLFGQRESGLQAMLRRAGGVQMDKSLQRADWSRRPLTPAMVAYAARDAEMTLVLYGWLKDHYGWAVELHEVEADEPTPDIAAWILPYLEGGRPRPVAVAVTEAGLAGDPAAQRADLLQALHATLHPPQRARVMRLITDLEISSLAPEIRPSLMARTSEERAGAARALGRFHDSDAIGAIRLLMDDPVQDVRQAAKLALDNIANRRAFPPRATTPYTGRTAATGSGGGGGAVRWRSDAADSAENGEDAGWQSALRAAFGITPGKGAGAPDEG